MVYLLLADGFEEIEALTPVDYLRRVGVSVETLGVTSLTVKGGHGITVTCDRLLADADKNKLDLLILPGGLGGVKGISESETAREYIRYAISEKKLAAICAAPTLPASMGLLKGRKAICYPDMSDELTAGGATVIREHVVSDGNLITSMGPGTAEEFAFALVKELKGSEALASLKKALYAR